MKDILDSSGTPDSKSKKSLLKSIREKCLDCCCHQHSAVRECKITDCSLWLYRMGKNPFHRRTMTDEKKEEATQRLLDRVESA